MQTVDADEGGAAAPTPRPYVSFEYVCKFCFKKFKSGHALGGHQNLHRNDEQREVGKYCGLTFGFEDRRKQNAVATPPANEWDPRVPRRGVVADGSGQFGPGLNRQGGPAGHAPGLHPGVVARDSILAMARGRLNNQNQGRRRRRPVAPMLHVPGRSTGTETGSGGIYSPETILPGRRFNQGPNSVVGDNFSNHGFNRWMTPPTMGGNGSYYYQAGGEAQQPPYGGFIEDHFGRWNGSFSCIKTATLISECGSIEVSSHLNYGVDLDLKL